MFSLIEKVFRDSGLVSKRLMKLSERKLLLVRGAYANYLNSIVLVCVGRIKTGTMEHFLMSLYSHVSLHNKFMSLR